MVPGGILFVVSYKHHVTFIDPVPIPYLRIIFKCCPGGGDFHAWIGTYDRIMTEKNLTESIGGEYFLSTCTFICHKSQAANFREMANSKLNETVELCIESLGAEGSHLDIIREHVVSRKPPMLLDNGGIQNNTAIAAITSEHIQTAVMNACKLGGQNNDNIEWYSEQINSIAREQGIRVVDMWNVTKGEAFAEGANATTGQPNSCDISIDGIHYREPTQWKELPLWFEFFSSESAE